MINKEMTLKELVKNYPSSIEYLNDMKLDYCCGGNDTLEKAILENNLDLQEVINDLEKYSKAEDNTLHEHTHNTIEKFTELTVNDMMGALELDHHIKELDLLREIDTLLIKILNVHYKNHSDELIPLYKTFSGLKTELEIHFAKEEQLVFPKMMEKSNKDESFTLVSELEDEHEVAGDYLKKITELTNDFTPPADACYTYKITFEKLEELVKDVYIHVFKENSILFPEYREQF